MEPFLLTGREDQELLLLCAPALIPLCGSVQWQQLGVSHGPVGCPWWETLPWHPGVCLCAKRRLRTLF